MTPGAVPHLARERRLTLFALMSLAYFSTSGGAFGIEPLVGSVGPGWAVALILIAPLVWSLPMTLMVAELATLMPEEGGYYIWVRETLGPFWAVQEAWWTMGYSLALLAIFPVLFVSYLSYFVPALDPLTAGSSAGAGALLRWSVALLLIVSATAVNLRGSREVGGAAKVAAVFIVGTFVALIATSSVLGPGLKAGIGIALHDAVTSSPKGLLLGLSIIILNFSGWDSISTYAGEVDQPRRNYPLAVGGALLALVLGYLLPVLAGLGASTDPAVWSVAAGWPEIARLIGGPWLGGLLAAAALVSMWALFSAQLLYVSRLPYVMACDGWLPARLARVSATTAVPTVSILLFSVLTAVFAALSYSSLTVILCLLNVASIMLELLALLVLRVRRPDAPRSFRVPGGWWGLTYVCAAPLAVALLIVVTTLHEWATYSGQLLVVTGVVVSGIFLYFARRRMATAIAQERGAA